MALNPPLTPAGDPCRVEGEYFILSRKGMEFSLNIDGMGKKKGKGHMVLTTARMVLINDKRGSGFDAFDIPLAFLFNEKFK